MSKKANGEGSIYFRKKKKLWCAVITVKLNDGASKKLYFYDKKRKAVAEWLAEQTVKRNRGLCVKASDASLYDWLTYWLETYAVTVIKPATRTNYTAYIEKHIKSSFLGTVTLAKLTTDDIQIWINYLAKNGRIDGKKGGLSPKTIRNIFNMLHSALKQALGNNLIYRNPAEYVILPKNEAKESRFLTVEEQKSLCSTACTERWFIGILLMLFGGLRIGELLALRRSDVTIGNDGITYISVSKSLTRVTDYENEGDGKTILKLSVPKTKNSVRQIPVIPELTPIIKNFFAQQEYDAYYSDNVMDNDPFIICNKNGGFIDPGTYRKWLKEMTDRAGLIGVTPHTLRHTYASNSLRYGIDMKNISTLLGHSSVEFSARTYIHTNLEAESCAVLNLSPLFSLVVTTDKEEK